MFCLQATKDVLKKREKKEAFYSSLLQKLTSVGTISKAVLTKLLRDRVEHMWAFCSTSVPP